MAETLFELPEAEEPKPSVGHGKVRLKLANRQQIEWRAVDLDSQISPDHPVRLIWELALEVDMTPFYEPIKAVEGQAGQNAIDPRILLAVWMYAIIQGVGSARALDRLCQEHDAYRWICGGVSVNYHALADFRVEHEAVVDKLITQGVASLMAEGLVKLHCVAHDGKRVRASAGAASFRRRPTLEKCLEQTRQRLENLRQELDQDPGSVTKRQRAARERAAKERKERVEAALKRMQELEAKQEKRGKKENQEQRKRQARASTTDPEAHKIKMADAGWRPGYNLQVSSDVEARVIVNISVTNQGNDTGLMLPSLEQIHDRYQCYPKQTLDDGGFVSLSDITEAEKRHIQVYAPVPEPRKEGVDPYALHAGDTPQVMAWRARMATEEAKQIYKQRAATAEWVNAWLDNWGLDKLRVRSLKKANAVLGLYALTFNLLQGHKLRMAAQQLATA